MQGEETPHDFIGDPSWKQMMEREMALHQLIVDASDKAERAMWERALRDVSCMMAVIVALGLSPIAYVAWRDAGVDGLAGIGGLAAISWLMLTAFGLMMVEVARR